MTLAEKNYRSIVNRLGGSLLFFFGLFILYSIFVLFFGAFTNSMPNALAGEILYQVVYGLLYAATFCLPVLFFYLISRGKPREAIRLSPTLPRETPLYIFAAMAAILSFAYLNSLLMEALKYNEFIEEAVSSGDAATNYGFVLMLFTTAVVPAFVEEFLFRGLVLTNLLPYGRTTAVVASALLFGAMHQNAGQFLYATAAGIVLGLVYVKTKSLWCGVLLHLCNNAFSVIETSLAARLNTATANAAVIVMETAIIALGIVSGVILFLRRGDPDLAVRRTGAFEVALEPDPEWSATPISPARRVKLFFSPTMILFLVACALAMVLLILFAQVLY